MKNKLNLLIYVLALLIALSGCGFGTEVKQPDISLDEIPAYSSEPYVAINGNIPYFEDVDYTDKSYESYSELDYLGRCGVAMACVGRDIMPTEERGEIGQVKPAGWQIAKYSWIDGKYLYNRCHLLGFQLTGENANEQNLITGTRYMNVQGMLPFENMVADYVKDTGNHVLYRVTPIYQGDNLIADGVTMEAYSIEDEGKGVCFNVFCYNVQPGVVIDYLTGDSYAEPATEDEGEKRQYILNTKSKKVHLPSCPGAQSMNKKNRDTYHGVLSELLKGGYTVCGSCNP